MHAPQLIVIGLALFALGGEVAQHSQPRTGNHNGVLYLIGTIIQMLLLWWGGFFSH